MEDLTRRLKSAIQGCQSGPYYESEIDCSFDYDYYQYSDDIDLSGNAREGPVPKTTTDEETAELSGDDDDDDDDDDGEDFGRSGAESK